MNTSFDPASLMGARVKGIQEYAPEALEESAARLGMPIGQLIKLDANENPYGPTRHTQVVLNSYSNYHRYPDPVSSRLRRAIAAYVGADEKQIVVGNGGDEIIDLLLRLFRPGPEGGGIGQAIVCPPAFGMYSFYATLNDIPVREVRRPGFLLDIARIEALCSAGNPPSLLFLTSPSNPDGQLISKGTLRRILALPIVVVLDEAYVEFSTNSFTPLVHEFNNLVILRSFSKWAGLAGLRVGYGVLPPALADGLARLKSPYNVNSLAQLAALSSLEDLPEARANIARIVAERERFTAKLREFPFVQVYPSEANFVLCRFKGIPISAVRETMERRGILLRYYDRGELADCVRITVGTQMQDEAVLVTLRSLQP